MFHYYIYNVKTIYIIENRLCSRTESKFDSEPNIKCIHSENKVECQ